MQKSHFRRPRCINGSILHFTWKMYNHFRGDIERLALLNVRQIKAIPNLLQPSRLLSVTIHSISIPAGKRFLQVNSRRETQIKNLVSSTFLEKGRPRKEVDQFPSLVHLFSCPTSISDISEVCNTLYIVLLICFFSCIHNYYVTSRRYLSLYLYLLQLHLLQC